MDREAIEALVERAFRVGWEAGSDWTWEVNEGVGPAPPDEDEAWEAFASEHLSGGLPAEGGEDG